MIKFPRSNEKMKEWPVELVRDKVQNEETLKKL